MTAELRGSRIKQADYQSLRFVLDRCENGNRREKTDAKTYMYERMEEIVTELLNLHDEADKTAEQMRSMRNEMQRMRGALENLTDRLAILRDEARISGNRGGAGAYDFAMQEIERIREGDWKN